MFIYKHFRYPYLTGEGRADFGEPADGKVDVTLTLTTAVLRELLGERLTAFNAYMTGELAISGDLKAAMKLSSLFESLNHHDTLK